MLLEHDEHAHLGVALTVHCIIQLGDFMYAVSLKAPAPSVGVLHTNSVVERNTAGSENKTHTLRLMPAGHISCTV